MRAKRITVLHDGTGASRSPAAWGFDGEMGSCEQHISVRLSGLVPGLVSRATAVYQQGSN